MECIRPLLYFYLYAKSINCKTRVIKKWKGHVPASPGEITPSPDLRKESSIY